ncbi:hypothetical protein [Vibrio crassostreae]|uniref:hypothetical protein n=1 Tax=Vibrio crassostreae TaxID=246167 RepID=UPI001B3101D6|nr:hypothetical protein [Vibrio crassostreae]
METAIFTEQCQVIELDTPEAKQILLTVLEPLINESDSHTCSIEGFVDGNPIDLTNPDFAQRLYEDTDNTIAESVEKGVFAFVASSSFLQAPSPTYHFLLNIEKKELKYRKE